MGKNDVDVTLVAADQKDGMEVIEPDKAESTKTESTKADKPDNAEVEKLKRLLSKANSEANSYKEQLRAKQTEQERAEAERAEAEKAKDERLAELERIVSVGEYTNKCMALKFEPDLAAKTAGALADGNMDALFDCLHEFVDATVQRVQNELLNRQPGLSAGTPPTKANADDEFTAKLRRYAGLSAHR